MPSTFSTAVATRGCPKKSLRCTPVPNRRIIGSPRSALTRRQEPFHLVGLDKRGTVVLRTELSRSQFPRRLANVQRCLVGPEAGCGAHHIAPTDQRRTGKVS